MPAAAAGVLLLAACAADDQAPAGPPLEGTKWILDADSVGSLVDPVPTDARVDLTLEGGQASGTSACNTYGGPYTRDGAELSFGPLGSTQMACDEPLMELEVAYLAALGDVTGYEIGAGELVLTGGDTSLSYVEDVPPEPLPLTATEWRLTTIASGTTVSSTIAGTEVTARFGDDGIVSGSDGCNRYTAPYETSDGELTIDALAATKMACEPDVQQQAADVAAAMAATAAYEIDGSSLSLLDATGGLLLQFDGAR